MTPFPRRLRAAAALPVALVTVLLSGLAAGLLCPGKAGAVLIASGDGSGNTTPPADDPGFANVGVQAGATSVYLGEGWVLTANHVVQTAPVFDGVAYAVVAGSNVQLQTPGAGPADLRMFRIHPHPPLPSLTLHGSAPALNAEVVLIGRGRDRGPAVVWDGNAGFESLPSQTMRWGTNRVSARNLDVLGTRAFSTDFSASGTTHESQAMTGDSGGAVFLKSGGTWRLVGLLYAVGLIEGQPGAYALYGNLSYAAQLPSYASQIEALRALPVCGDGFDNDADGLADWPLDPGCVGPDGDDEVPACSNGMDDDGDGQGDWPADLGCRDGSDTSEEPDCSDGLDNDGDGLSDWPADPGCYNAFGTSESPACDDDQDNDGDGLVDLADPECTQSWYASEHASSCGLGFELALLVPLLQRLRRRAPVRS